MAAANKRVPQGVRRSERVRAHVPVTLIWHQDENRRIERTYTSEVSRFGCLVLCQYRLAPGTAIRLEYSNRIILGKISYSLMDFDTKLTELGIGFDEDGTQFWGVDFEP